MSVEALDTPAAAAESTGALSRSGVLRRLMRDKVAAAAALILTLIALPLSRANPRHGRFAKLLPSIFLYICYMSLLLAAQSAIAREQLSATLGVWPIHIAFLAFGLWLNRGRRPRRRRVL